MQTPGEQDLALYIEPLSRDLGIKEKALALESLISSRIIHRTSYERNIVMSKKSRRSFLKLTGATAATLTAESVVASNNPFAFIRDGRWLPASIHGRKVWRG